ncbi:FtsX-like permease family protein [Micromonospora sp. 067-2]|uniref:FtsX-like permease family protein n=1 Tax=Micromonospora sp. 067-2 TaxID=2789270 RepID=UPI00397B72B0
MSYLPFVRLGLRLCRGGGTAGLVRLVLQAAAVAFGAFVLLATLAAPGVADRQDGRLGNREPVLTSSADSAACLKLRTVEDNIGSRPLRRIAVWNATAQSPRPPGVPAWPAAGEIVLSPALSDLIGNDPAASARFPQRVVGVVAAAGLVAPDELLAYIGVPAGDADRAGSAQCVARFGTQILHRGVSWTGSAEQVLRPAVLVPVGMAVFVLIPLGIFLAASARLSAATRERRLAALRLLGADARQTQVVNAVETGAVAAVGAAIGIGGWLSARGGSEQLNLGHLHWFAGDLALSPFTIAMTAVGLPLYAVAVATGAFARLPANPLYAFRNAASRRPALLRIAPITCGVALLTGAAALPATRTFWALLAFTAGIVLSAAGLPLLTPLLVQNMWQRLNHRPGLPPALRIAGRRALAADGAAARLVATVGVTLFAAGIGLGAAEHVRLAESLATPSAPTQLKLTLDGAVNPTALDTLRATPGIRGASQYEYASAELGDAEQRTDILIATCADVRGLFDGAETCSPDHVYRLIIDSPDFAGEPPLPAGATLHIKPAPGATCPAARNVVAPTDKLELTRSCTPTARTSCSSLPLRPAQPPRPPSFCYPTNARSWTGPARSSPHRLPHPTSKASSAQRRSGRSHSHGDHRRADGHHPAPMSRRTRRRRRRPTHRTPQTHRSSTNRRGTPTDRSHSRHGRSGPPAGDLRGTGDGNDRGCRLRRHRDHRHHHPPIRSDPAHTGRPHHDRRGPAHRSRLRRHPAKDQQ